MAASVGYIGKGAILSIDAAIIGQVRNITAPGITVDTVETSNMESDDSYKEYIAAFADGGEVTFDFIYDKTDTTGSVTLDAKAHARGVVAVILTLPTAVAFKWTFSAIITNLSMEVPYNELITRSVTLKVTGKPVLAAVV